MARINGLWIGEALSPLERACVQSFLNHGHDFHLYCYGPLANVPAGCRLEDAAGILPQDSILRYERGPGKGSVTLFSNMFRYRLLHLAGGWWVDLDMFCLTDVLPERDVVVAAETAHSINCAIMFFPAGHPAMLAAYEECVHMGSDADWGDAGPRLLTRMVKEHSLGDSVFPRGVFYPIHFSHFWMALDPRRAAYLSEKVQRAAAVHLWHNMMSRAAIDKNIRPPRGSLLDTFYEWTIGTAGFSHEYVLNADSPMDSIRLEARPRP